MFKKLTIIILFAAFAVQTFDKALIVFNYYSNTVSFAKNCENKAKPMMHCNGRCQMMKKLKQEENKEKQNPGRRNDNKDEIVYYSKKQFDLQPFNTLVVITFPHFNNGVTSDIAFSFFQPPKA